MKRCFDTLCSLLTVGLLAALLAGCTTTATYNPSYIRAGGIGSGPRYQGKLLVFTNPSDDSYVYHGAPKSATGFARQMNVPLGKMTREIAGEIYGHLFDGGYEFGHSIDTNSASRFSAIVHPRIEDFAWRFNQAQNAGFAITPQVKMSLGLQLLEDTNRATFERNYESGWVNGNTYVINFSPMELVNEAIHKTMADLMARSIRDLDPLLRTVPSGTDARRRPAGTLAAIGTAFLITDDGYLLTCAHVVKEATRIEVACDGTNYSAKLVKADAANDVAVIKVTGSFKALPIAASRTVKLGDSIFTIGFPNTPLQGTEPKLTKGEISSLAGFRDDPRDFQVSVPVQPGNSGGPLVDLSGNVIGIVAARLGDAATFEITGSLPQNVNYALKSSFITAFLETLPDVSAKLKSPRPVKERPLAEVVDEVKQSVVLVTVY